MSKTNDYIKKEDFDLVAALQSESKKHINANAGQIVMIQVIGSGSMVGGSGWGAVIFLSGDRNVHANQGDFKIMGKYEYSYNIARGANGQTSSRAVFGEYFVEVNNACNADKGLSAILGYPMVWLDDTKHDQFCEILKGLL